jgi:hypothetical protein
MTEIHLNTFDYWAICPCGQSMRIPSPHNSTDNLKMPVFCCGCGERIRYAGSHRWLIMPNNPEPELMERPDLDAIEAWAEAAAAGPWTFDETTGTFFFGSGLESDPSFDVDYLIPIDNDILRDSTFEFIARSITDVPALVKYVRRLEARLQSAEQRGYLRGLEECAEIAEKESKDRENWVQYEGVRASRMTADRLAKEFRERASALKGADTDGAAIKADDGGSNA